MNLHAIVAGAIGAVNPQQQITVQVSTGNTVAADGTPTPGYATPVQVMAQVQALTGRDIEHADALNISGIRRSLYLNGEVDGLVRTKNKGGDLIQLADGSIWLVAEVTEHWPDWTKCIIVLQDDQVLPAATGSVPTLPGGVATSSFLGFGQIRYAVMANSAPVQIAANTRTQLQFAIDPTQTNDYLKPPFAGALSFDGSTIHPRGVRGDLLEILINLLVTPQVSEGEVQVDLDVGSPLGPTDADTFSLFGDAGSVHRVTLRLLVQTLTYFCANGGALWITSTVPITLTSEAVMLTPRSMGS